ncbi:MAG TPA: BglII/BstYI family type II restriction endonuclease [Anaerolineae bacterium]|nr:BglII/BstYI family type II restriction endonuclease [Anaerolineae bacterium]
MIYESYAHRFADIILNADYALKMQLESVVHAIGFEEVQARFEEENLRRKEEGKKLRVGKQSTINKMFKAEFRSAGWELEKNVFNDPDNDLTIDFWKGKVGVDVAFVHRSSVGGDLLRLQAAAEVKNVINVGVYICPTRTFAKEVSPNSQNMVNYERARWYLRNFYAVLTAPILLIGLRG